MTRWVNQIAFAASARCPLSPDRYRNHLLLSKNRLGFALLGRLSLAARPE